MDYFDGLAFPIVGSDPHHRADCINRPHYYGIQYHHAGILRYAADGGSVTEFSGPHVFLTRPGREYHYGPRPGETRHHSFLCCWGPRIDCYLKSGLLEPDRDPQPVPVADPERFLLTILEIIELVRSVAVVPPRAVLKYEDLLLQIRESAEREKAPSPFFRERMEKLAACIREAPEKNVDFAAEAHACSITLIHFRRLFKAFHGLPPQQFLLHCRLEKAAALLLHSPVSIAEAAERAGFSDPAYFARLFKQQYRMPPLKYRQEFQVNRSRSPAGQ